MVVYGAKLTKVRPLDLQVLVKQLLLIPVATLLRLRRKDVWLVSERPDEARDNGYWFFRYVHENQLHADTYYVIEGNAEDAQRLRSIAPDRIVAFGSLRHYLYYALASVHISAHVGGGMINSRVMLTLEKARMLRNAKVFLQHGVIRDVLDWAFQESARIDLFCCSAQRELDFIRLIYGYRGDQMALTGLCRFDNLSPRYTKKQILVMPTWRRYLADSPDTVFVTSDFFRAYTDFIANRRLIRLLEVHNCQLLFHPHPKMQPYLHLFPNPENPRIQLSEGHVNDLQGLINQSFLLVTDYSSISFDFAFAGKAMLYYQFDYDDYYSLGHWEKGYFDDEADGFGPVARDLDSLIDELARSLSSACKPEAKYSARASEFFAYRDDLNCSRVYEAIVSSHVMPRHPNGSIPSSAHQRRSLK